MLGAVIVPAFGRVALHGTNAEYNFYRYIVPLIVGSISGFFIGLMKDRWLATKKAMEQEIAEHKLSRQALQKSDEKSKKYLDAIDSMGVGILIVDQDYYVRYMNKTTIEWFGDQTGLICHSSIAGVDSPCSYCQLKNVIEFNKIIHYTPTLTDGRSFEVICYPVQNDDGSISKMEIIQDKTEIKKAEIALKDSEKRFFSLTESLVDTIYEFDLNGRFTYVNEAGLSIFGYSKDEILGSIRVQDTIPERDHGRSRKSVESIFKGDIIVEERTFLRKDGSVFVGEIHAGPVYDGKKIIGARGLIRDITERKKIEEEREKLINELQEAHEDVNILSGLLPICAKCKKIRDDKGYWNKLEVYIQTHSDAEFTHGICPECSDKLYGDEEWYIKMKKKNHL